MAELLPDHLHLEIVSPYRQLVSTDVDEILLPGTLGQLGILPGHRPLLTTLDIGEIAFRSGSHWTHMAVEWGFAEVLGDRVTVLAQNALSVDDFDPNEAMEAKRRAEERLHSKLERIEIEKELGNWKRALVLLDVARKSKKDS